MLRIYSRNHFASYRRGLKIQRKGMANLLFVTVHIERRTSLFNSALQPRNSPKWVLLIAMNTLSNTLFLRSDYSVLFLDSVLEGAMKIQSAADFK